MKTSELRIGNLIMIDNEITEITGISNSSIYFEEGFIHLIVGGVKPIPLTEEWLLKFGFVKSTNERLRGRFTKKRHSVWKYIDSYQMNHSIGIKFVHHLQNLYFALTGEELTLKQIKK